MSLKSLTNFFERCLISMLRENKNILEPIILIKLQKLFGKKLCTDLDFATNFWEKEQKNLKLPIINNEISAWVYYVKPKRLFCQPGHKNYERQ